MKTIKVIYTMLFVLGMAQISFGQFFQGSVHDFELSAWNPTTGNEKCAICHTPHNADLTVPDAPLWDHFVTVAAHTPYPSTGSIDAVDLAQPSGISLLCLSCHDGSVALDNFATNPGVVFIDNGNNDSLGIDLRDDHPISFTYDDNLATILDGELWPPTTTISGLGLNIDDDMLFGAGNDQLECASCHDVHSWLDWATNPSLLLKSNAASALCLTCHNK